MDGPGDGHCTTLDEPGFRVPDGIASGMLHAAPFGVLCYRLAGGSLVLAGGNPAAERILGLSLSGRMGERIEEVFPGLIGTDAPERFRAVAQGGEPLRFERISYADGRVFGAYDYGAYQAGPGLVAVVFEEITQRKLDEIALYESRELYARLFEDSHLAALLVNPADGRITDANAAAAAFYGYPREVLQRMRVADLDTDPPDVVGRRMREIVQKRQSRLELRHRLASGETSEVEVFSGPIVLGGELRMLSFVHDIAERRRMEDDLATLLKEKELLLREMHHRVANNLQLLSSLVRLQSLSTNEPVAQKALGVVDSRLSTIAAAHGALRGRDGESTARLDDYATMVVRPLVLLGEQKGIAVVLEAPKTSVGPELATPLGLILNELVTNSLKHAFGETRGGEIRVRLACDEQTLSLEVSDNGLGIRGGVGNGAGNGTGMDIVQALARQIGGTVETQSGSGGVSVRMVCPLSTSVDCKPSEAG